MGDDDHGSNGPEWMKDRAERNRQKRSARGIGTRNLPEFMRRGTLPIEYLDRSYRGGAGSARDALKRFVQMEPLCRRFVPKGPGCGA